MPRGSSSTEEHRVSVYPKRLTLLKEGKVLAYNISISFEVFLIGQNDTWKNSFTTGATDSERLLFQNK